MYLLILAVIVVIVVALVVGVVMAIIIIIIIIITQDQVILTRNYKKQPINDELRRSCGKESETSSTLLQHVSN